jgi:hypothetical protein
MPATTVADRVRGHTPDCAPPFFSSALKNIKFVFLVVNRHRLDVAAGPGKE